MARAVAARRKGDDYQARLFWREASRLFLPRTPVASVGFDVDDVDGFDDVVVKYQAPVRDELGREIELDCWQVKFHVDQAGELTAESLLDPGFIGGTATSLLQRLQRAQQKLGARALRARLQLATTWGVRPGDPLARLASGAEGAIREHVLREGGDRSAMGKLRRAWRDHLSLRTDEELLEVLRPLRLRVHLQDLAGLSEDLSFRLDSAGLRLVEGSGAHQPYDDLIYKLHGEGRRYFTASDLKDECARSGLWLGRSVAPANRWGVGVRSFMRFGANLEDDVDALLCVTDRFDGRSLRREGSWAEIYEALRKFLEAAVRAHREIELCLDAHATLAFASGFMLEPKLGITIDLIQRSRTGVSRWAAGVAPERGSPWSVEEVHVGAGGDLALAVSVTHDIDRDVAHFVQKARLPVERILSARVLPRPGASSVRDGAHALALADSLAAVVKTRRPPEERARLHLFFAAPNGLLFFLGQLAHGFGPLVIYEHDFESGIVGAYVPSLALPQ